MEMIKYTVCLSVHCKVYSNLTTYTILGNAPVTVHHKMSRNCSEHKWLCAICMCENTETCYLQLIKCKHKFHANCIGKWLEIMNVDIFKKEKTCPYCRTVIDEDEEYKIKSLYQQGLKIS
jgi:hypothetical protein